MSYFINGLLVGFLLNSVLMRIDGTKPADDIVFPIILIILGIMLTIFRAINDH